LHLNTEETIWARNNFTQAETQHKKLTIIMKKVLSQKLSCPVNDT